MEVSDKISIYHTMKKIRLFEQKAYQLATQGFIPGSVHFYIGEEAIAAAVCHCLKRTDYIMSTHRCHGHLIAKGGNLEKMVAELMGKASGYCKGKGGTMHLSDPGIGMMGANGVVGAGIPIAVGLANACKDFKKESIVVSFFGDGAINTGAFHESLNLAATWNLPVIFICENNKYAISTDVKNSTSVKDLSKRAASYGIDRYNIDGNDVIKIAETTNKCIRAIKEKEKPSLMVCNSYRQLGHSIHDPRSYRTKEEENKWEARDPVARFESLLLEEKILGKKKIEEIEAEIKLEIDEAVKFAKDSRKPAPEELQKDVYVQ